MKAEKVGSHRRLQRGAAMLAVLAVAGVASGCGVGPQSVPEPLNPRSVPYGLLNPSSPTSTSEPELIPERVTIYLEGKRDHLVPVVRRVTWPATLIAVLAQLASGPSASESSLGLVSPASSVGPFDVAGIRRGVATIDLPTSFENLGGQDQIVAAGQVVLTATTFSGIDGVRFLVNHQAAEVPSGNGNLTSGPSTRSDYAGLVG